MENKLHTKKKIIICWKCDGTGEIQREINIPPCPDTNTIIRKIEYDVCNECKGTGRLIKIKKWSLFFYT